MSGSRFDVSCFTRAFDEDSIQKFFFQDSYSNKFEGVDADSILELRNGILDSVSQLPIHITEPNPQEMRILMDRLKQIEPQYRRQAALGYIFALILDRCKQDPSKWLSFLRVRELPRAKGIPMQDAARELSICFGVSLHPLSPESILGLTKTLDLQTDEALRLVLDAVQDPQDWHTHYADSKEARWEGVCLAPAPVNKIETQNKSWPASMPPCRLPPSKEMKVVLRDGRVFDALTSKLVSEVPKVCAKGFRTIVAVTSVPMTSCLVAIVKDETESRSLMIWDMYHSDSYACLHEFGISQEDFVDVQLSTAANFIVRAGARMVETGCERSGITLCLTMSGSDVSTLQHTSMDVEKEDKVLSLRLRSGHCNHLDHGNVLAFFQTFERTWGRMLKVYYGFFGEHYVLAKIKFTHSVFGWGNPHQLYVYVDGTLHTATIQQSKDDSAWLTLQEINDEAGDAKKRFSIFEVVSLVHVS
jgi:hypothetical protein